MEQPFWQESKFRKVILYGSAVRGDYNESSDIDLFFDVGGKASLLNEKILKAERGFLRLSKSLFLRSSKAALSKETSTQKIASEQYDFSIIVDDLSKKKWEDLRRSMSLHAITLYDRYSAKPASGLKQHALVSWFVSAKDAKTRVKLARTLYGYSRGKKRYSGLLEKVSAKKVSQGVVLVASKHINIIRKALDQLGVKYNLRDIYTY